MSASRPDGLQPSRRRWLGAVARAAIVPCLPPLGGCDLNHADASFAPAAHPGALPPDSVAQWLRQRWTRQRQSPLAGGFVDAADIERGHRWRDGQVPSRSPETQRTRVAIVGSGVAGLAAARALRRSGVSDFRVFELADSVGGNSRAGEIAGIACPWGAHYLPIPPVDAHELVDLLVELGVARRIDGRVTYDEKMRCHSPQERLLFDGHWIDGLMPPGEDEVAERRDAARFAALVKARQASGVHRLGSAPRSDPETRALDTQTFAAWLDAKGLRASGLRWYLDYCCRDDYGAGIDQVSAWAGLHYFASRHGFFDEPSMAGARHGIEAAEETGGADVLTWPQGNGWLIERMAQPLRERIVTGAVVSRVSADSLDVWRVEAQRTERWFADHIIIAAPLFIAARLLTTPVAPLQDLAGRLRYASWRVANVHLDGVPRERAGSPRSWDNVIHGDLSTGALGYVDAMHQSLRSRAGPTVLTCYAAFGAGDEARRRLLSPGWQGHRDEVLDHLQQAHPDIRDHARRVDIMRWGHAMLIPTPGLRTDPRLAALREPVGTLHFAHADLAAYSVFEESFAIGHRVGLRVARELG